MSPSYNIESQRLWRLVHRRKCTSTKVIWTKDGEFYTLAKFCWSYHISSKFPVTKLSTRCIRFSMYVMSMFTIKYYKVSNYYVIGSKLWKNGFPFKIYFFFHTPWARSFGKITNETGCDFTMRNRFFLVSW